jgi:CCR4-NOT transcriptional regulation complex NOT5 subunit
VAFVALVGGLVHGQSLGDIARENREKKSASGSTKPAKVITNKDLPTDPDGEASTDNAPTAPSPESVAASRKAAAQRAAEQRAAEQWKQKILAQKNVIANLQARADALRASIQFVDPDHTYDSYSPLAYNRHQARQVERLKGMEAQLAGQKQKLEDMQEAARHAGMHTPVYDP